MADEELVKIWEALKLLAESNNGLVTAVNNLLTSMKGQQLAITGLATRIEALERKLEGVELYQKDDKKKTDWYLS